LHANVGKAETLWELFVVLSEHVGESNGRVEMRARNPPTEDDKDPEAEQQNDLRLSVEEQREHKCAE